MEKDLNLIMNKLSAYAKGRATVSYPDPFKVLISTVLSQRTKDANTEKAAAALFAKFPTAKAISNASLAEIRKLIKGAGFFKIKANRIKEISKAILKEHDGKVPCSRAALEKLPGVGAKTSACTMVYAFSKPEICVDVHMHRISNRLGVVNTKTPEETESGLREILPKKHWLKINQAMVRFGQKTCLPRNPKHEECGLRGQCDFFKKKGKWKNGP